MKIECFHASEGRADPSAADAGQTIAVPAMWVLNGTNGEWIR